MDKIFAITLFSSIPFIFIWSMNTLFGYNYEYNFETYLASSFVIYCPALIIAFSIIWAFTSILKLIDKYILEKISGIKDIIKNEKVFDEVLDYIKIKLNI